MKTADFIFSLNSCGMRWTLEKRKQSYRHLCKNMEGSHWEIIIFSIRKMTWLHFHVTVRGLKANATSFFSRLLLNNFLTPSVRPFGSTDWIRFMHKAPTHASGLLMTGPYADTLTAMSNYFKYTGEGQSSGWPVGGWEVEGGDRETEGERHLERGRGEMGGKRNTPQLIL